MGTSNYSDEFKPGSLGPQIPNRTLALSLEHRMLVKGSDSADILVPAKALTRRKGITAPRLGSLQCCTSRSLPPKAGEVRRE